MRHSFALFFLVACHHADPPPPEHAPERVMSSKARAQDLYIKGYNTLVDATARHVIGAHNTAMTLSEMAHQMPRFGVQHELMKTPLREAGDAFGEAKSTDPALAATTGFTADALLSTTQALTESLHHLSDYYDRAGFQTDNEAQKDSLAAEFDHAEEAYQAARAKLEQALEACNDQLASEELQSFAAARSYGYWVRRVDIDAKMLERGATHGDGAAFKAARVQFNATVAELQTFSTAHPKGAKTFAKLVPALATLGVSAERLEPLLLGKNKDAITAESLTLERAYTAVAKLTARLYEMETSGGLE